MKPCVIFDLDGTLADCNHRRHHVDNGKRNWPEFFATMADDPVIEPVARLARIVNNEVHVVACSGRPEEYREATEKWLLDNSIPINSLYMRPSGDTRIDHIVKEELLERIVNDGYDPFLVIDDRPSVVEMWRRRGLICLQADPGRAEEHGKPGKLTLMVGPSGAGKSHLLAACIGTGTFHPSQVVSSDQIRKEICGDFRDQTRNEAVFSAVHAFVRTRLIHGLPTIVDATNIRRKDRVAMTDLAPIGGDICYTVVNRPMAEKYRDAGWRRELPFDLIAKHEQTFKSQIKDILSGDGNPAIEVKDLRS